MNKTIKYLIVRAPHNQGYYIDLYIGDKLFKTKTAKNKESLAEYITNLETQLDGLGFSKVGI